LKTTERQNLLASLSWLGIGTSTGTVVFVALWAGINTGPENLDWDLIESGWRGFFNVVRTAFPLAVLIGYAFNVFMRKRAMLRLPTMPEALWLYYGLVCFVSTIGVSPWFEYAYWGFAYLSVFAATETFMYESKSPIEQAAALNRLNWVIASGILAVLVWVSHGHLVTETSRGTTGYGLIDRMPNVAGMPMSRETGLARFAAIPALLSLVILWTTRGTKRLIAAVIFAGTVYLIWLLQSRGALFSFVIAASFAMILLGGRARRISLTVVMISGIVYFAGMIPNDTIHAIYLHATRNTQGARLLSASGRTTRIFPLLWNLIKQAPVIGYGWRADRRVAFTDGQNGFLYALLCGGFLGGLGFIAGLLAAWVMIVRLLWHITRLSLEQRTMLIQVTAITMFFTLRTIPENCAALYSVDFMIQLPALVYLGELDRQLRRAIIRRRQATPEESTSLYSLELSVCLDR
jgi:hypothetical protein